MGAAHGPGCSTWLGRAVLEVERVGWWFWVPKKKSKKKKTTPANINSAAGEEVKKGKREGAEVRCVFVGGGEKSPAGGVEVWRSARSEKGKAV